MMKKNVFEKLYQLAMKKGEKKNEKPYYYRDGDFGSSREYDKRELKDGHFTLTAQMMEWKSWGPTSDSEGVVRSLDIRKGGKLLCHATIDDWKDVERFSAGEERYEGKKSTPSTGWRMEGTLPKKYE